MSDTIRYNGPKFAMVPEWLLFDPEVSMAAKTVYAALARHGSTEETCFPSVSRLAALLGSTTRTVRRLIDELVECGAVERHARYRADGGTTSNGYTIWGTESAPPGYRISVDTPPTPMTKTTHPPRAEMSQGLGHFSPRPLGQKRPTKESPSKESHLTRKHTRVDSRENAQQPLIEVDGLAPAASVPDRFQEFYDAYGRKVGRAEAINEWKRAIKKVPAETIIEAATKWRAAFDASGSDPCYVPHPSRWLKREQWADELPRPKVGARQTTRAPIVERTDESMNMRFVDGKLVPA